MELATKIIDSYPLNSAKKLRNEQKLKVSIDSRGQASLLLPALL